MTSDRTSRLRRGLALTAAAAVAALGAVVLPTPAQACACGGYVAADGYEVAVNREVATIAWDGETERILLEMDVLTDAPDAALLIPTPAPAEVALGDAEMFDELLEVIAPEVEVDYTWWPDVELGDGAGGAPEGAPPSLGVDVLETVDLGPLEASVLAADDADGLAQWLDEHGYVMQDGLATALRPYITEGWYYVAMRLTTDAADLTGELQPVDLTFPSESLIYPMRLSAAAATDQFVRTYVFADRRMARTDASNGTAPVDLRFAGPVDPAEVENPTLADIAGTTPYLTVMDQWFHEPGSEIVSDFTFSASTQTGDYREVVHETRMREILGMPAGPVLTFLGLVAVALALLLGGRAVSRRARRRAAAPRGSGPAAATATEPRHPHPAGVGGAERRHSSTL
ncbi:DUF2330 domain-containing protein [Occultella glacieicola]|uniref:DUF2330 domain-containing protein n=1 Tax=Occultella glacieicola TaxID=2518684 RepID=A0ABY2EAG7_9MICO|nr:DUF2330 domain-containing protein [Occultella glacieicola]TDE98935.1 DUF2330 domain-containing protein [Occultella glacieicola]